MLPRRLIAATLLTVVLTAVASAEEPTTFPQSARDRYDEGQQLRKNQQYQQAIAAFDQAIKMGMDNYPRVHLYKADSLRGLKEYDKAIANYTEFIEKFGIEESCRY
jgi:tetratricopeptide (TPR) repeat protein